jgi:hypothetical protein
VTEHDIHEIDVLAAVNNAIAFVWDLISCVHVGIDISEEVSASIFMVVF